VASIAGLAGLSLWVAPAPIAGPWDVFALLDGGYRIYEGQAPSTDFSNPIGPLVYGLVSIGMRLQHAPSLKAVTYGNLIFLAIATALAWSVVRRRLPAPFAAGFTVFVALLAVSVRPLGFSPWITTYAMLYNRDGWLLYSTLLLLVLLKRAGSSTMRSLVAEGFLIGLLLGLLFYCKITFFLAGALAAGVGLALSTLPRSARLGAAALAGLLAVGVTMQVVFGLHTTAYIGNLLAAAQVQVGGQRTGELAHSIIYTGPVAAVAIFVVGGLIFEDRRRGGPTRRLVHLSLATAYVLGSSLLLTVGNADERADVPALVVIPLLIVGFLEPGLPRWAGGSSTTRARTSTDAAARLLLAGLAALLVATTAGMGLLGTIGRLGWLITEALVVVPLLIVAFLELGLRRRADGSSTTRARTSTDAAARLLLAGLAALLVATTLPIVGKDALGLGKSVAFRSYVAAPPTTQRFSAERLNDFVIPADAQWKTAYRSAHALPEMINDGLRVLRRNLRPGDTVFTLAYTDPFSFALGLPSSRCGPLWWDLGFDFDRKTHPDAQCAIGSARWVMIPRMVPGQGCCQETVSVMLHLYSGYLSRHFAEIQRTSDWILLRRVH
jgi:hypothetical protein